MLSSASKNTPWFSVFQVHVLSQQDNVQKNTESIHAICNTHKIFLSEYIWMTLTFNNNNNNKTTICKAP